jgi:hypothetical protein
MIRKIASCFAPTLVMVLALVCPAAMADLYWESEQVSQGVPGQPDGSAMVKNYVTAHASLFDYGERLQIMDFDAKTIYQVDKLKKTYVRLDFNTMGGGLAAQEGDREKAEAMQAMKTMLQSVMGSIKVTPTSEIRKIAGYSCRKYLVNIMMVDSEYWASKEVKGYEELKEISARTAKTFAEHPVLKQMNVAGLVSEIDGFPVQTITHMMGGTTTVTLKKIEKKKLSPTLFTVPEGYVLETVQ